MSDDEAKRNPDVGESASDSGVDKKSDYPLKGIKQPGPHDVLCGRGGGTNNHEGNINFRQLVNEHKLRYLAASKVEKPKVAREVVKLWRELDPPGRFLSRSEGSAVGPGSVKAEGNVWHDVGDKKAREKASQCLRERTPDVIPFVKELQRQQDFLTDQGLRYVEAQMKKGAIPGSGIGGIVPPPPPGVPPPPGPDGNPIDGYGNGADGTYFSPNGGNRMNNQMCHPQTQQQQRFDDVDNAFDPEHHAQHGQFLNIVNTTASGEAFPPFDPEPPQSSIIDGNCRGGHMGVPQSHQGHHQQPLLHPGQPINSMGLQPDQGMAPQMSTAGGWGFQNVQVVKRRDAPQFGNNPSMPPPNGPMSMPPPSVFSTTFPSHGNGNMLPSVNSQFGNSPMGPGGQCQTVLEDTPGIGMGGPGPDELTLEEYHQSIEEYMTTNRLPIEGGAAAAQEFDEDAPLNDDHSRRKEMGEMRENSWVRSFHSIESSSVSMMSPVNSLRDVVGDTSKRGSDSSTSNTKQGQGDRNDPARMSDSTIQVSNVEVEAGNRKPNHVQSSSVEPRCRSTLSAHLQKPVDSMSRSQKLRYSSVPSQGMSTVSGMSMYSEGQQSSRSQKMATAHDLNSNISMMSELTIGTDLSETMGQVDLAANNVS